MSTTTPIGYVTAYGAAVRGGYSGTYEEFCAEQANFAGNAQQVAASARAAQESASLALNSRNAAAASEQNAAESARMAQASIDNAKWLSFEVNTGDGELYMTGHGDVSDLLFWVDEPTGELLLEV